MMDGTNDDLACKEQCPNMILVTGAAGLIGRHFCTRLEREGRAFRRFDLRIAPEQDTRNPAALAQALEGVSGVVHLAAVSRVVTAQGQPDLCWETNVDALKSLLSLCGDSGRWIVFASSREVYGQPLALPVAESAPLQPMNIYARSKVAGEALIDGVREKGVVANVVRFSSVYGCPQDHEDRVAMAFAWAGCRGGTMRLEGGENVLDFTYIDDAVDGLWRLCQRTEAGERLPPIQFVSGRGVTLRQLADMAARNARGTVRSVEAPPRDFDVSRFIGDPARAAALLGWRATTDLETGVARLIDAMCEMPDSMGPPPFNGAGEAETVKAQTR
jgi:nucleoside-diphosphate-sugar epimerase